MRLPLYARFFSAAVLPAHGPRERLPAASVPEKKRRPLVRDGERGESPLPRRAEPLADKSQSARLALPESGRIVLDAVGGRDPRRERLAGEKNHPTRAVVEHGARARAALVQNE